MQIVEAPTVSREEFKIGYRTPSDIPIAAENEEKKAYITQMKEDSQISYLTCCGINFEKYVLSSDASLVKNQGKIAKQKILTRQFTKKQYEYIKSRLSEKELKIFNEETGHYRKVKALDEVIFIPLEEYNPMSPREEIHKEFKELSDAEVKEKLSMTSPIEDFPKMKKQKV